MCVSLQWIMFMFIALVMVFAVLGLLYGTFRNRLIDYNKVATYNGYSQVLDLMLLES